MPTLPPTAREHGHQHAEAFSLMRYLADDGSGEDEIVWNSRDGVAPFAITLRSGKTAHHTDWHKDTYAPDHKPEPGTRMFVDLTEEHAHAIATERAREAFGETDGLPNAAYAIRQRWDTPEAMAAELAAEYLRRPGSPHLVEVTA